LEKKLVVFVVHNKKEKERKGGCPSVLEFEDLGENLFPALA